MTDQEAREKALTYLVKVMEDEGLMIEYRMQAVGTILANTSEPWDPAAWNDDDTFSEMTVALGE